MVAAVVMSGAACTEKLVSSASCPIGCSDQTSDILNVTLDDVVTFDTTVSGGTTLGTDTLMLMASRGDSLDARTVIRFDVLPESTVTSSTDTTRVPISFVDSAQLHLTFDSTGARIADTSSVLVYDVGGAANDTAVADLAAQFTPANLIGVRHVGVGKMVDTVSVTIDPNVVLQHILTKTPLRVGMRLTSSGSAVARLYAVGTIRAPGLTMRVSPDTLVAATAVAPNSSTPANNVTVAAYLRDFSFIVSGNTPVPPGLLVVGGLPGTRAYLRFNIPPRYLDSSIVVRATLVLNQKGNTTLDGEDSMSVQPLIGVAAPFVTDPSQAARITSFPIAPMSPLRTLTDQTTQVEIQLAPVFKVWAVEGDTLLPRAVILQALQEGSSPQQALFYTSQATDPALRPKLRISYSLRTRIGTP
jgi:hypothetical protein